MGRILSTERYMIPYRQEDVDKIDFRCVYRAAAQPDARCILNEGDQSAVPKGDQ